MIYQFDYGKITFCSECPINDFANDKCNLSGKRTKYHSKPEENDCPLVAISKTETDGCEWCELEPSEKIFAYGMGFRKMPLNYCPNCGRRLEKA